MSNKIAYTLQWLLLLLCCSGANAQTAEMRAYGRYLINNNGDTVVLRGVNSGLAEDGNYDLSNMAQCQNYIDQIAMSGAKTIRFTWYTDGVSWRDGGQYVAGSATPEARYHKGSGTVMSGYISNGHLGNIFSYCHSKGIIPVLAIHDLTCSNDWAYFNNDLKNWWTKASVVSLVQAHKDHIVLNLANEMGMIRWSNNSAADYNTFKTNYNTLVAAIRAKGIKVPLMIDAPDCGQSATELLSIAADILNADPEHNVIFSSHAYWSGYASTPAAIGTKLGDAVTKNVVFVLGEVANRQDNNSCGDLDITSIYQSALTQACPLRIGWYAWSWDQDCSPLRNMTANGNYNTLTAYGSDIVNNTGYGLKATNGCGSKVSVREAAAPVMRAFIWQQSTGSIRFLQSGSYSLRNLQGQQVAGGSVTAQAVASVAGLPAGMYVLVFHTGDGKMIIEKIINN